MAEVSSPLPTATSAADANRSAPRLFWPQPVQVALGMLLGVVFLSLFYQALGTSAPAPLPVTHDSKPRLARMDLNQMDRQDFLLLPGVGDKLAQRIWEHRQRHGPFRAVEDLRAVAGIGPKILDRLRPLVFVAGSAEEQETVDFSQAMAAPVAGSKTRSKKEKDLAGQRVNINQAKAEELQKLPGIGPKMAQRIIDHRQDKGAFRSVLDLRKVSGIGPKTLEKLKPHVALGPAADAVATGPAGQ